MVIAEGVVFGETVYPANGTFGPRIQREFQLVCVLSGSAHVEQDSRTIKISANHLVLMTPGHTERFVFDKHVNTAHTWCAVAPELISSEDQEDLASCTPSIPLSPRMAHLISAGLDFGSSRSAIHPLQLLGLTCLQTYRFEATASSLGTYPEHLMKVLTAIEGNLGRSWSINKLAEVASISPQHLIRLFKRHLGSTPSRYLWDLRTRRGIVLLRETGLSVTEISERVGFSSPFHFTRLVKLQIGSSPREIRANAWRS